MEISKTFKDQIVELAFKRRDVLLDGETVDCFGSDFFISTKSEVEGLTLIEKINHPEGFSFNIFFRD